METPPGPPTPTEPAPRPVRSSRGRGRRARRLRWTLALLAAAVVLGTAGVIWGYLASQPETYMPGEEDAAITRSLAHGLPAEAPEPRLVDVTQGSGLERFVQFAGPRSSQLPEDMGSGAAWGDYDNDGDDDLVLVSAGGSLGLSPGARARTELFENLGGGRFRAVASFPEIRIIGMGAAWGDYDADGWLDLVVTGYGVPILLRNEAGRLVRDERFSAPPGFWAGAAWGDYDRDRDLDLYVCGYVRYVEQDAGRARATLQYGRSVPYTLNPASYRPERNLLFRNEGDGTFTEIADEMGVANREGRSLGALWHDFDDDGRIDLYVANDISDNVFFRNTGDGFEEISHAAWVADYRGAMGLAAGDWNRDGDDDLFVTHWVAQENALYDSQLEDRRSATGGPESPGREAAAEGRPEAAPAAPVRFVDVADQRGLGQVALRVVGWGTEFADLDGDGWLDIVVANGSTFETDDVPPRLEPEPMFLFWNRRGERFYDLAALDETLSTPRVSRGLALADYDGDGDLDVLLVDHGDGARLLRNDMQQGNWLELRLRSRAGAGGKPRGRGEGASLVARVGQQMLRRSVGSVSYLSQSSSVVHFGLGDAARVDSLAVRWPDGEAAVYGGIEAGTAWELVQGEDAPRRWAVGPAKAATPEAEAAPDLGERERVVAFWSRQRAAMKAMKVDGDLPRAIVLFREALALKPAHEDSLYYLANCLAAEGDIDGAVERLGELTRVNPMSHRGFRQLGSLRATAADSRADLDAAAEAVERALSINPEETGSLLLLGEIDLLRGELESAAQRLSLACRTNPRAVDGFFLRAYIAWRQGDASGAAELLGRAREARGEDWKPSGTTAEGDVEGKMHEDETPLSRFWQDWDGSADAAAAFAGLDAHLRRSLRP